MSAPKAPRVTVVIPAHGVGPLLSQALASLQAQGVTDWEAVVVDDGDPSVAGVFAPFAADRRLRLLRTSNGGVSTARNRGVEAARAPLVAFLDGDDLYLPPYLASMLAALESDEGLGFVACDAFLFGEGRRERYSERYPMDGPVTLRRVLAGEVNIFTATTVRREAFRAVGGFDPGLAVAEDLDLWVRLLTAGWRAEVVPEALVRYRRRAGSLSSDTRRLMLGCCAVYRKAALALQGAPEADVAEAMEARWRQQLDWLDGEALILRGEVRAGLALLRGAHRRSPRWRLMIGLMRLAPWIAGWLLRMRPWLPAPRAAWQGALPDAGSARGGWPPSHRGYRRPGRDGGSPHRRGA